MNAQTWPKCTEPQKPTCDDCEHLRGSVCTKLRKPLIAVTVYGERVRYTYLQRCTRGDP